MPKNPIVIENVNLGGLSDSKYQGIPNSVAALDCIDIHTEPWIIRANTTVVNERNNDGDFIRAIVPAENDNTYFFGSEFGTVWKRTSAAVWSSLGTIANGGVLDAMVFDGYIYYATATKLGRWQVGAAFGTRDDNWATFTVGDTDYHPMKVLNKTLYIWDGYLVAQVDDAGVFTANALDLETDYPISCLGIIDNDLLIGTHPLLKNAKVFRWDTYSQSFNSEDECPEYGINAFLSMDNQIVALAGTKGNAYLYNGEKLVSFKKVPWYSGSDGYSITGALATFIYPNAVENINGRPVFGLSKLNGAPAKLWVYSISQYSQDYPVVLNFENQINGNTSTIKIGAIKNVNRDTGGGLGVGYVYSTVFYTWKDGTSTGVAVSSQNKKDQAFFETRVVTTARSDKKTGRIVIPYRSIPNGTYVQLYISENYNGYSDVALTTDTERRIMYTESNAIPEAATYQLKVLFGTSGANTPEIEWVMLEID